MGSRKRAIRLCVRCGKWGPHAAKGLCVPCYTAVRGKSYYLAHREQLLVKMQQYYAEHREELIAWARRYRVEHQGAIAAWYALNRTEIQAREKGRSQTPQYKGRRVVQEARRTARKKGLPNTLTREQWTAIKAAYKQRCAYCGLRKKLTQDHVIAVTKDGGTVAPNIVPACKPCNSSKGNREPASVPAIRLLL